jgi:hypothetical protein
MLVRLLGMRSTSGAFCSVSRIGQLLISRAVRERVLLVGVPEKRPPVVEALGRFG